MCSYIKLRMDRVLRGELNCSFEEATKSNVRPTLRKPAPLKQLPQLPG